MTMQLAPELVVHRIGGGAIANLRLKEAERGLQPPGISLLLGGTPSEAVGQMRTAFPRSRKWMNAIDVGTATVDEIRTLGFDVIPDPTTNFANHARLIHAEGVTGFADENLARLAKAFQSTVEDQS